MTRRLTDRGAADGVQDLSDRGCEIAHASARNDDRVPATVRFLGDAKELPAIVLPEFHVKTLPFDLEFFRVDDAVHIGKRRSVGVFPTRGEANSAGSR